MKNIMIIIDETKGLSVKGRLLKDIARQKGWKYFEDISEFIESEEEKA